MVDVWAESPGDAGALRAVHRAAFPTADEAALVDALRESQAFEPSLSLVAWVDGDVVGHALCSGLGVAGGWDAEVLAPVAVTPPYQGHGIGSTLVREALDRTRRAGHDAVFLHGAPGYYQRFGFEPAGTLGFENPFDTPGPEFMVAVLTDEPAPGGRLRYPPAFAAL